MSIIQAFGLVVGILIAISLTRKAFNAADIITRLKLLIVAILFMYYTYHFVVSPGGKQIAHIHYTENAINQTIKTLRRL